MYNNLRFTENANNVLQYAGTIALQFGSYSIDTEHILYGLTKIKDSVNPRKWVCVEAEKVVVENRGNLIILIMSSSDNVDKLLTGFNNL